MTAPLGSRRLGDPYFTGAVSVQTLVLPSMYSTTTPFSMLSMQCWQSVRTTVNGVATFWPTTTGASSGTSFFSAILSVQATAKANTALAIGMPWAAIKSINTDLKSVTVNVTTGTTLLSLGATLLFAPDGTEVFATVWGLPY